MSMEHFDFEDRTEACAGCPLVDSRYVPAYGKGDTRYFVVGAAPGPEEEKAGKAFVGPAGKLVRELLSAMGLEPVFTNVLKRRPKAKKPSRSECFRCGLHLIEEMKAHRAAVILTLGQVPFEFLNGQANLRVDDIHGLPMQMNRFGCDFIVVPTFSAGYILRSGGIHSPVGDQWVSDLEDFRDTVEKHVI